MECWLLPLGILCIAFLYSSVGHAGASGYIAILALSAVPIGEIRPITLTLNIVVAILGGWNFYRAGHCSIQLIWPLVIASVPFAFLGGYLKLPNGILHLLLGTVLWGSAVRFLFRPKEETVLNPQLGRHCWQLGVFWDCYQVLREQGEESFSPLGCCGVSGLLRKLSQRYQ